MSALVTCLTAAHAMKDNYYQHLQLPSIHQGTSILAMRSNGPLPQVRGMAVQVEQLGNGELGDTIWVSKWQCHLLQLSRQHRIGQHNCVTHLTCVTQHCHI